MTGQGKLTRRGLLGTGLTAGLGVVESEARSAAAVEVRALAEDVARGLG